MERHAMTEIHARTTIHALAVFAAELQSQAVIATPAEF
jgi:hypothetical protein